MIKYRWARSDEVEKLIDLIEMGFAAASPGRVDVQLGKEYRVLFTALYSRPDWRADWVWVGEEAGRLVAAVGFFPQQLSLEKVTVSIWAVSPVVTHPDYRGQGIGAICLTSALERIRERGITAVFLWGIPAFYPKFGFVPILPRYKTKITVAQLRHKNTNFSLEGRLRCFQNEDLPSLSALYDSRNGTSWLQPPRSITWWQKRAGEMDGDLAELQEAPFPKRDHFLVWTNPSDVVLGYLYFQEVPDKRQILINEGMAANSFVASEMIQSFIHLRLNVEDVLYIRGTPDHDLNRAAYGMGGIHLNPAPFAGMIKVLDWKAFFGSILPLLEARAKGLNDQKRDFILSFSTGQTVLTIVVAPTRIDIREEPLQTVSSGLPGTIDLTKLVFGLYEQGDLVFITDHISEVRMLFPRKYPFIWDANYLY